MPELDNNSSSNGRPHDKPSVVETPVSERRGRRRSRWRAFAGGLACGLPLMLFVLGGAATMRDSLHSTLANVDIPVVNRSMEIAPSKRELARLQKQVGTARARIEQLTPDVPYLIVDTSQNRIRLMSGQKLLHEAVCSSGSYVLLKASNNQQWMFSTPRGVFRVLGKHNAPVWRRPDWAFVEEGLPIPGPYAKERYEAGVLGEHGIDFGNGYLIHGTLYQRQLGLPVTHGCIRLGDEDLRIVYRNLQVGSKIFIY
jgi:L,D-transpeptidase YbiS